MTVESPSMHPSLDSTARTVGVTVDRVHLELQRAIRRSEPDAREVYAVIRGLRLVGRRAESALLSPVSTPG